MKSSFPDFHGSKVVEALLIPFVIIVMYVFLNGFDKFVHAAERPIIEALRFYDAPKTLYRPIIYTTPDP
jgi:hypothetical protein